MADLDVEEKVEEEETTDGAEKAEEAAEEQKDEVNHDHVDNSAVAPPSG